MAKLFTGKGPQRFIWRKSTSTFFKLAEIQICEPPYSKYEYIRVSKCDDVSCSSESQKT